MAVDTYTKLLLHGNGDDASTTITDDGVTGHTVTAVANTQLDTAQKKFGTASILFDGTGDYLSVPDHADFTFGTGAFTIDFWVRFAALGAYEQYLAGQCAVASTNDWGFRMDDATTIRFFYRISSSLIAEYTYSWGPSTDTWYHVELGRNGANMYLFIDGVSKTFTGSVAIDASTNFSDIADNFEIGGYNSGASSTFLNGWIDEYRVSKGVIRHTGNFTPPTQEYPLADGGLFIFNLI